MTGDGSIMSRKKIFMCIVLIIIILYGVLQIFVPLGPNADEIYRMVSKLYGVSFDYVNKVMGEPSRIIPGQHPRYIWTIKSIEHSSSGSFIECLFQQECCVAVLYVEVHYSSNDISKRYARLLSDFTKKFGKNIISSQNNSNWFQGNKELSLRQRFPKNRNDSALYFIIKNKDLVLSDII